MDRNQEIDEIDELLLKYFKCKKDIENIVVPQSTQKMAQKVIKRLKFQNNLKKLSKVAVIFITVGIMTTGVVFAKDIVNFITSLFTNSTPAIDSAVENGYLQNVNMDYVYSNGIGIKAEHLILDDFNLDISFSYESDNNTKEIKLEEYTLSTENDDLIYDSSHSIDNKVNISNRVIRTEEPLKINDTTYKESILFNLIKTDININTIKIYIKKLKVKNEDNSTDYIEGNWKFNIRLDKNMINGENILYDFINDNNIDEIYAEMTATEFVIKVKLKIPISLNQFYDNHNFTLENNLSEKFVPYFVENGYIDSNNMETGFFTIHYNNINKYMENTDELKLNINIDEYNIYTIKLLKKLVE